jgi:hypothetical protein
MIPKNTPLKYWRPDLGEIKEDASEHTYGRSFYDLETFAEYAAEKSFWNGDHPLKFVIGVACGAESRTFDVEVESVPSFTLTKAETP